jgi:hypothetical protein
VRLKYDEKSGEPRRIGFQIKSNMEAIKDAKRPRNGESIVAALKRQAFEAHGHAGVAEWWIVSCFDAAKYSHLVSAITVELTSGQQLPLKIRHVTPPEAMALLQMEDAQIEALCTLFLCEDDEILRSARKEVLGLSDTAQTLVLNSLGPALEGERTLSLAEIYQIADLENDTRDEVVSAVNVLESRGFFESDGGDSYIIDPSVFVALCALYFEGRARHGYHPSAASNFLLLMTQDISGR